MAQVAAEEFESVASHGTTLTTSNTSFDAINGAGTLKGNGTNAIKDTRSGWVDAQASATVGRYNTTTLGASRAKTGVRLSFMLTAAPGASSFLINFYNTGVPAQLGFTTSNQVRIRNNNTVVGTPITLSLNTKYYARILIDNGAGTMSCTIYDDTGTQVGSTMSGTYDQGAMAEVDFGSNAAVAGGWSCIFDEIVVDNNVAPALPSFSTPIADSDTGSGAEGATPTIAQTVAETGSDTETESSAVTLSDADTGAGAEGTPSIAFSDSDTGSGTETEGVVTLWTDSDAASGTETESSTAALSDAETGSGVDAWALVVTFTDADSSTGDDTEGQMDKGLIDGDLINFLEAHEIQYGRRLTALAVALGGTGRPAVRPYPFPS